jgi:hypothetical protein
MSDYLFASFILISIGVVGFLYPESGRRAWGSVEEVRNDPEKVAKRTKRLNKFLSVIIVLFGVLLLILAITQ